MPRQSAIRAHPSQWAFRLHRVSGLALACYLPVHFYLLADQIGAEAANATAPWFASLTSRLAHAVLAGLLGAHLVGGLRVMAIHYLRLNRAQGLWLALAVAIGFAVALTFALALHLDG